MAVVRLAWTGLGGWMKQQVKVTVVCLVVCGWVMMTWVAEWAGGWAVALFLAADGVRWCWSPCVMCCAVLCVGFG